MLKHWNTIREKVIGDEMTVKKLVNSSVKTQKYYQRESYRWSNTWTVRKLVTSSVQTQEYYQRDSYTWWNTCEAAFHFICLKTGILTERKLQVVKWLWRSSVVTSSVETQEYYQRESYRWWNNCEEACYFICWNTGLNTFREIVVGGEITVKKLVTSSLEIQEYYQRESYRSWNNCEEACGFICWNTGILSERKLCVVK